MVGSDGLPSQAGGAHRVGAVFKLTRADIVAAYAAGRSAVVALIEQIIERFSEISADQQQRIEQQEQRIATLEQELRELRKDSHDSGKPPSRDSFERKQQERKKKSRKERRKRPGGQPNHPGATLCQAEEPTTTTVHTVEVCQCGRSLAEQPVAGYERRQVFDVPPLAVEVTEHRSERKRCPDCGQITVAEFPVGVEQPVQYGHRLQAMAAYLRTYGLLPYRRTAELFEDLFSIPISEGTLANINAACGQRLAGMVEMIRKAITGQPMACFDETGMSIGGTLHWLHVASTALLTHYAAHAKRGREAFADIAILPQFAGVAVHDHWQSYFGYECEHGLCNAHHLRELTFVEEQYDQGWAAELKELLLTVKDTVDSARHEGLQQLDQALRDRYAAEYQQIIAAGLAANPAAPEPPLGSRKRRGRKKQSKPRNLLLRLSERSESVLAFMNDFLVPFDNNQAERDLRMMKVQQKISGTFRSRHGAEAFCRTRAYISTIRKNGLRVIDALISVFEGRPMVPPCLKTGPPP